MLIANLGEINVTISGKKQQFEAIKLSNNDRKFTVDGRYKIVVNIPQMANNTSIACVLISQTPSNVKKIIESGEKLALISFRQRTLKKLLDCVMGDIFFRISIIYKKGIPYLSLILP